MIDVAQCYMNWHMAAWIDARVLPSFYVCLLVLRLMMTAPFVVHPVTTFIYALLSCWFVLRDNVSQQMDSLRVLAH